MTLLPAARAQHLRVLRRNPGAIFALAQIARDSKVVAEDAAALVARTESCIASWHARLSLRHEAHHQAHHEDHHEDREHHGAEAPPEGAKRRSHHHRSKHPSQHKHSVLQVPPLPPRARLRRGARACIPGLARTPLLRLNGSNSQDKKDQFGTQEFLDTLQFVRAKARLSHIHVCGLDMCLDKPTRAMLFAVIEQLVQRIQSARSLMSQVSV